MWASLVTQYENERNKKKYGRYKENISRIVQNLILMTSTDVISETFSFQTSSVNRK